MWPAAEVRNELSGAQDRNFSLDAFEGWIRTEISSGFRISSQNLAGIIASVRIFANTVLECSCAPVFNNTCVPERSRYLPDYFSGASSERRPLPCTANPCASPLHQQVTEVPKSQGFRSCSAYNIASSALGQTPLHAPNAFNKTGSRLQFRPRAPQNSPGAQVRLASCIPHSPEMLPAPRTSWFRRRTAEQTRFEVGSRAAVY